MTLVTQKVCDPERFLLYRSSTIIPKDLAGTTLQRMVFSVTIASTRVIAPSSTPQNLRPSQQEMHQVILIKSNSSVHAIGAEVGPITRMYFLAHSYQYMARHYTRRSRVTWNTCLCQSSLECYSLQGYEELSYIIYVGCRGRNDRSAGNQLSLVCTGLRF